MAWTAFIEDICFGAFVLVYLDDVKEELLFRMPLRLNPLMTLLTSFHLSPQVSLSLRKLFVSIFSSRIATAEGKREGLESISAMYTDK